MEANICDINHLDSDVLLPPRKRLLAVLKKQTSDGNSHTTTSNSSTSSCEMDTRLNNLLRSQLSDPNLLPREIVESSRSAAEAAVKAAESARALAEEKAAVAAKAVAAAKTALEMVANLSGEPICKERYLKKNDKLKKHVQVEMLYNKNKKNGDTDEELARNLHRVMNSSPRMIKNSSCPDLESHKHKRLKTSTSEKTRVSSGLVVNEENPLFKSNVNAVAGEVDSEGSMARVEESKTKFNKEEGNREEETIQSNNKIGEAIEETSSIGRKRGRIKQKKLPLSICNFRDQTNPIEEMKSRSLLMEDEMKSSKRLLNEEKISNNKSSFSMGPSGDSLMTSSTWKCQAFKAQPTCVEQNKVLQS